MLAHNGRNNAWLVSRLRNKVWKENIFPLVEGRSSLSLLSKLSPFILGVVSSFPRVYGRDKLYLCLFLVGIYWKEKDPLDELEEVMC